MGQLLIGAAALAGIGIVGVLDFVTGVEYRVYPLYFLPLSLAAWHLGRRGALVGAALCGFTWLGSNYVAGRDYTTPAIWIFNFFMQGTAFVVVGLLISSVRASLAREEDISRTDSLTALLNRRAFYEATEPTLALARRHGHPVTLAYIDVDNFKSVNDLLGHEAGDRLLRGTADVLRQCTRKADVSARFGGDEFVVLLPETGPGGAEALLERLRSGLSEAFAPTPCSVTVSIGAVSFTQSLPDIDEVIRQADAAMYEAKAAGKNRVRFQVLPGQP